MTNQELVLDHDIEAAAAKAQMIATIMDDAFTIPGTNIRFGVDSFLGFIPVLGDTLGAVVSSYIIGLAHKVGVPWHVKCRMIFNAFIDWFFGLIPFIGDLFDIGFKANRKNAQLLLDHIEKMRRV